MFYGPETKSKIFGPGCMIISVRLQRPGFHSALGLFALGDGSALTRGGTGFKQVIFKCRETEAVPSLREYSAEMAFEKMSCKQFGRLDVYSRKWGTYLTPPGGFLTGTLPCRGAAYFLFNTTWPKHVHVLPGL